MRVLRFLNVAILSVLVGSAGLLYAQDEKQQEDKPTAGRNEARTQDRMKPSLLIRTSPSLQKQDKQEEKQNPETRTRPVRRPDEAARSGTSGTADGTCSASRERTRACGRAHSGRASGAGKGGHVPDDKFHAHFGQEPSFQGTRRDRARADPVSVRRLPFELWMRGLQTGLTATTATSITSTESISCLTCCTRAFGSLCSLLCKAVMQATRRPICPGMVTPLSAGFSSAGFKLRGVHFHVCLHDL